LEAYLATLDIEGESARKDIVAFREQIRAELGESAPASRKALGETIISLYSSIILISLQLAKRRPKGVVEIAERVSWLSGTMLRALKTFDIQGKVRPRTLADIARLRPAPKPLVPAPKEADTTASQAGTSASSGL
jgi:hypothetical protein